MLFGSAMSKATLYFFCLLSNAFPDFGSVGRFVGKEKTPKKKEMEKKSRTRRPSTLA